MTSALRRVAAATLLALMSGLLAAASHGYRSASLLLLDALPLCG